MPPKSASGPSDRDSASKKRKDPPALPSGPNNRKAQLYASRLIPSQPPEAALKDGELDLQAFVAAHEFEIRSLEQSMATTKAGGTSRAFQKVPRGLRRRTASHNPKRVPKRLRAKAIREMTDDNTPTVEARKRKPRTTRARIRAETAKRLRILADRKRRIMTKKADRDTNDTEMKGTGVVGRKPRPKIRRNLLNEPPTPPAKFRKRQLNKTWLPTHPWHAKRARMTEPKNPLWRFAIPLTPNEKMYRPLHRSQGDRGAVVWDMSYMSTIGLCGNPFGMERVLKRVGVTDESSWNHKGRKWRLGTRSWSGLLSRNTKGGIRQICPSTIIWNPTSPDEKVSEDPKKQIRQVFLRVHPSAFLEVFNEILRLAKMETPQLYIEDLRYEIGSIETTGPASTELLLSVITPHGTQEKPKSKHAELFQSLTGLSNPAALPSNSILGFSAQDPRLRYPPRKAIFSDDPEDEMKLLEVMASWPAEERLKTYSIFNRDARHSASLLPSQGLINRRRSAINPGSSLKSTTVDPPIPILLLANRSGTGTQIQGTWTLLAPWKCIMPFWHSFVHCPLTTGGNPRFAGMNETMQVAFERGLPWFPADFISTDAGVAWELEQRRLRNEKWDKQPKSKRVEWKSLDLGAERKGEIGDGSACDFEFLFGLSKSQGQTLDSEEPVSTESDTDAMDVDGKETAPQTVKEGPVSLRLLNQVAKTTFNQMISSNSPPCIPPNAIVNVRISILGRGIVGPCARIYRLPSTPVSAPTSFDSEVPATIPPQPTLKSSLPHDLRSQWLARIPSSSSASSNSQKPLKVTKFTDLETRKRILALELTAPPAAYPPPKPNTVDIGGHPLVPDAEDLIGFVTTGSFNLSDGRGLAIGSVAVEKVIEGIKNGNGLKLCVVREAGENVGWIARWEAI